MQKCQEPSDINEHLPTLRRYAEGCKHVTECGVRGVTSSYAFGSALVGKDGARMIMVDLDTNSAVSRFMDEAEEEGVDAIFYKQSDLDCPLEKTELLFIDTWHVYGHLKRELERWHSYVEKYILLHDTEVDGEHGEAIRCGSDTRQQSLETGIPEEEIRRGLRPAVEEFVAAHPEWKVAKVFTNNNGLTVLERS